MDRNEDSKAARGHNGTSRSDGTAAARLREAVTAATTGSGSRDEVQDAARALVAELRGRAEAPEQMLIQMKALLADAGLRAGHPGSDDDGHADHALLYRDLITWSIRCYYEDGKKTTT